MAVNAESHHLVRSRAMRDRGMELTNFSLQMFIDQQQRF